VVVTNATLAEALFQLAESHPPGDERLALLRAGYAVFDHPRELAPSRRLPETIALETLPTVTMLRQCQGKDAVAAAVQRLAGPHRVRQAPSRQGFLSAAEVEAQLSDDLALRAQELRGAVHWHTRASDGAATLEVMARTCMRRGASWAVVADHSRGLACVNGLDREGVHLQRAVVGTWNHRHGDEMYVLQGLEVEILEDGRLDLPRDQRHGLVLVAAVHTELAASRDQTGRLLRAIEEPGVFVLAHPRGRLFARRSGLRINWEKVFGLAAAVGVGIEINGFPRRQDLDAGLLPLAAAAGCSFVLASDAHHPRHLEFDRTALALASRAALPRGSVVNFEPLDGLVARLEARGSPPVS
jgi:histidinol phosphatase-like PHP family hydrolase